jgi:NADPH:quinone reductase-like Zn-dependent oxidoreductase
LVAAIGDDVSWFSVGDDVYAMVRFPEDLMEGSGAYAEYVRVSASELALKPMGIDHIQAAGAPMLLLTVWQFLVDVGHDAASPFQSYRHTPINLEGKTVLMKGAGRRRASGGSGSKIERRARDRCRIRQA